MPNCEPSNRAVLGMAAEGNLQQREFIAVYRTGDHLSGVLAIGMPPKSVNSWRRAIATVPKGTAARPIRTTAYGRR